MPGALKNPSPDNNIYVLTWSGLNEEMQVRNVAHEAYGHAYFRELQKYDPSVNPFHTYRQSEGVPTYDPETGLILSYGFKEPTNLPLEIQIKLSTDEALQNYRSRF